MYLLPIIKFLIGLTISYSIYYDLASSEWLLFSKDDPIYFGIGEEDFPLAIGCFSFALMIFISLKLKYLNVAFYSLPIVCVIYFGLKDICIFVYLFILIYILLRIINRYSSQITYDLSWFVRGWLMGGLIQALFFLTSNFERLFFGVPETPNIFGFQIYSFWVTYSAVMSIMFACLVITIMRRYSWYSAATVAPITFLPAYLAARKAAFLDLIVVAIFVIFKIMSRVPFLSKKLSVFLLLTILGAYSILYLNINSGRDISLGGIWLQRAEPYLLFINQLFRLDAISFLFGYDTGFGGYSNLALDIFVRGGLIGVWLY